MLAAGTNADFEYTIQTEIDRQRIWALWELPETWETWDGGLRRAFCKDGRLRAGSVGLIEPLSGPASEFRVTEMQPGESYSFETKLPLATLTVSRFFVAGGFTHRVRFTGALGWLWSAALGPGFRSELPRTMQRLLQHAQSMG